MGALAKRNFSAAERPSIENSKDLLAAMRAVAKSNDPAKTKSHIRARAKALGLTSELSDAFKSEGSRMFANLFGLFKKVNDATGSLNESIKSIVDDPAAADKTALLDETMKQFSDHLAEEFEKARPEGVTGNTHVEDDPVSPAVIKALGLSEGATEIDVLAAIEATKKAELVVGELVSTELSPELKKAMAETDELRKSVASLQAERDLVVFTKRAVDIGMPETFGEVLMKAHAGDKPSVESLEKAISGLNEQIKTGKLFSEFGTSNGSDALSGDAEMTAKVAELRKASPSITEAKARSQIIQDPANKDLVKRYNDAVGASAKANIRG